MRLRCWIFDDLWREFHLGLHPVSCWEVRSDEERSGELTNIAEGWSEATAEYHLRLQLKPPTRRFARRSHGAGCGTICDNGQSSPMGSVDSSACSPCAIGEYALLDFHKDVAVQYRECISCPSGKTTDGVGTNFGGSVGETVTINTCKCTPGRRMDDGGMDGCSDCPADTYSETNNAASCQGCPVGSNTAEATGTNSVSGCICGAGQGKVN